MLIGCVCWRMQVHRILKFMLISEIQTQISSSLFENYIPAVINTELAIINSLFLPRSTLSNHSTIQAPARIEKPTGIPLIPTPTGSCPYTLKA